MVTDYSASYSSSNELMIGESMRNNQVGIGTNKQLVTMDIAVVSV